MTYRPSLKDITFCLDHIADLKRFYQSDAFVDFDQDLRDAVLDAAGQLAQDILAPLNSVGDKTPAKLENGIVVTSPGFDEAVKTFGEGGWHSLAADPQYGGQGLPKTLEQACYDMFQSANMAFTLMPLLSQGAIEAIHAHGSDAQKSFYLPKMISGEWVGSMNLTEPQSGSDLAAIATRAEPDGHGGYLITGQKIFITWADHPSPDNIIHLVLARLPDAPSGTKGISLFLCPKHIMDEDGNIIKRNTVSVVGVEHKLGIHGSPTCVVAYEGAKAELIGEAHNGLMAMFTMMNAARLAVGFQGVGIAERAFQQALSYANDRKQGRSQITGQDSAPIYDHPDVRLMLALMKAKIDAARCICVMAAFMADVARHSKDSDEKMRAKRREDFFVPIAKAWSTDIGVEVASLGVQVHGGMGYIEETGAAQHYRDARIAPIYEGTNGIQALDLVGRKLGKDGLAAKELKADIEAFLTSEPLLSNFKLQADALACALTAFDKASNWLLEKKATNPVDVSSGATAYLALCGDLIGGWLLLKSAIAAQELINDGHSDSDWLKSKIAIMNIYVAHILSRTPSRLASITMGTDDLLALKATVFE